MSHIPVSVEPRKGILIQILFLLGSASVISVEYGLREDSPPPTALLIASLFVLAFGISLTRPIWASAIFLASFCITSLNPSWQLQSMIVLSCCFLTAIAYHGKKIHALIVWASLFVLGVLDPTAENPHLDIPAMLIWGWILVISLAVGWSVGMVKRRKEESRKTQIAELQAQRSSFASALHDSVVAQLTSMIMNAQSTALKYQDQESIKDDLLSIAAEGRETMGKLRELVDVLRGSSDATANCKLETIFENDFQKRLERHGFTVENNLPNWESVPSITSTDWNSLLRSFLAESATNIIKYAKRDSAVEISLCTTHFGETLLRVTNETEPKTSANQKIGMSTCLGLDSLTSKAKLLGGQVFYAEQNEKWHLDLQFPRAQYS